MLISENPWLMASKFMENYFKTVTLGAFTWRNEDRIKLLLEYIKKNKFLWILLHFLLVSVCLNFPVIFAISRLPPEELFNRMQTEPSAEMLNSFEQGYFGYVLLPVLGIAFGIILIIQTVFYLSIVFFQKIARLNSSPLAFKERLGLALYSSTLPVLAAAIFGLFLPTVHILIFYFIVMFFVFQRNKIVA